MHTDRVARVSLGARARRVAQWLLVVGRAEADPGRWEGQMLGLRSKVRELSTRMARSACRSSSRVGGLVRLPIDLEVGRESVASSKKALPSSEDHESACKQQHRTGEVSQEQGNAPSIRGALGSSAQCRHRRRQAEGSEAPQHGCPGSLNTLEFPYHWYGKTFSAAPPVPKSRVARWRGPPWRPSSVGWRPLTPEGGLARPYLLSWE